ISNEDMNRAIEWAQAHPEVVRPAEQFTSATPKDQPFMPVTPQGQQSKSGVRTIYQGQPKEESPKGVSDENRLSLAKYGKPFFELTPSQKGIINADITTVRQQEMQYKYEQQKQVQIAGAKAVEEEKKRGALAVELK